MCEYVNKCFWVANGNFAKNIKTEKQTHFAVTNSGGVGYNGFLWSFGDVGEKFCSKFVNGEQLLIY